MSSNVKKILLAIGIGVVVVAVPGALAILDWRTVSGLEDEVAKLESERTELLGKKGKLEALRKETKGEMATFERKKDALPTGREAESFMDTLAEFRQKAGIDLWKISKSQARQASGPAAAASAGVDVVDKYQYDIDCSAHYHQIGHLLSQIEHWDRFIQVSALNVKDGGKAEYGNLKPEELAEKLEGMPDEERRNYGDLPLTVKLQLTTYFYPEVVEAPKAPTPPKPPGAGPAKPAAQAPLNPEELAKLEAMLLEAARAELESGAAEEPKKEKLDKFLWPIEENARIRNPFNPLEALTPAKIEVEEPGTEPVKGSLTDKELADFRAIIADGIRPELQIIRNLVESGRGLVAGGSEEELLQAARHLENLIAPKPERKDKSFFQFVEDRIRDPVSLLDAQIKARGAPIPKGDVKNLVLQDLLDELAALRVEAAAFEKGLNAKKREIALQLAQNIYSRIESAFEKGDYEAVRETFAKEMRPHASGELGTVPGVKDYLEKAEKLDRRAEICLQFLKAGLKLTAIVLDEQYPERSVFMIEGLKKIIAVGEPFEVTIDKETFTVRILEIGSAVVPRSDPLAQGEELTEYKLRVEFRGEEIQAEQLTWGSERQQDLENGLESTENAKKKPGKSQPKTQPKEQPKNPPKPPGN